MPSHPFAAAARAAATAACLAATLAAPALAAGNTAFENEVIDLVNDYRASQGLEALSFDARLQEAALAQSMDMALTPCFQHDSCDGTLWSDRVYGVYPAGGIGENIAAGYGTPAAVMAGWIASPGHNANLLNPAWQGIGVGYWFDAASPYRHYWTQDFGTLAPVPEPGAWLLMLAGTGVLLARRRHRT
jgi:uncharacterized protein YkwD